MCSWLNFPPVVSISMIAYILPLKYLRKVIPAGGSFHRCAGVIINKLFITSFNNLRPYVAVQGGLMRTNYDYQLNIMRWIPITEDDLTYYVPGLIAYDGTQSIQNPHTTTTFGLERHPYKGIFAFEAFLGFGYRWSQVNTDVDISDFTNSGRNSAYFEGFTYVFGVKLGVFIY